MRKKGSMTGPVSGSSRKNSRLIPAATRPHRGPARDTAKARIPPASRSVLRAAPKGHSSRDRTRYPRPLAVSPWPSSWRSRASSPRATLFGPSVTVKKRTAGSTVQWAQTSLSPSRKSRFMPAFGPSGTHRSGGPGALPSPTRPDTPAGPGAPCPGGPRRPRSAPP